MGEIKLPRWIITSKTMPHGIRGPKKPLLVIEDNSIHNPLARILSYPESNGEKGGYQPVEVPGVFKNWEYRFWCMIVTAPGHVLAECRSCGHNEMGPTASRQMHFVQGGCTKRLCAAYDLLLRDGRCAICDHKTTLKKWGVLLCSSGCIQAWCESEPQPQSLMAALKLVGTEGWA